jgi:sodium transport system permease protein
MARNVRLLFTKELLGAVRDRRTLVLVVLFPLVFYPMVLAVIGRLAPGEPTRLGSLPATVLVIDRLEDPLLERTLESYPGLRVLRMSSVAAARDALTANGGHAAVLIEPATSEAVYEATIYFDHAEPLATIAAERVHAALSAYSAAAMRAERSSDGAAEAGIHTVAPSVMTVDVTTSEPIARMVLSRLLPYFLVLAILTGAMSFGAEITAGEKERGTIATLLVSQLSRTQIVLGKFLAVLTVSLVSSLLSAVGLLIGLQAFGSGLLGSASATQGNGTMLGVLQLGGVLTVLIPLAVVIAAVVIIVGSFARSQKEASTYLVPVYMVIVLVGLASMTGGVSLSGIRFLIPVANALFALQEVILGELRAVHLLYTLAANAALGAALVAASVHLFRREAVLFRS